MNEKLTETLKSFVKIAPDKDFTNFRVASNCVTFDYLGGQFIIVKSITADFTPQGNLKFYHVKRIADLEKTLIEVPFFQFRIQYTGNIPFLFLSNSSSTVVVHDNPLFKPATDERQFMIDQIVEEFKKLFRDSLIISKFEIFPH